ncbi:TPA: taste receptor, type 1, member 3-like [Bos taurus]|nr:TPA: taste receptor, type 1, member 3-like [Bos taurus]
MLGLTFLGLVAALGIRPGAPLCLSQQLSLPGDYILGGLFPLGSADDTGLGDRTQPNATVCTRLSAPGLLWALAVMMAVEEINNAPTLLPGLRLGYDLFDTCSEPVVAMKPSLVFMAKAGSRSIGAYCDYTQYQPRVLAVIGPHSSEVALVTGKFFSFFLMPQVSYGATTDRLSNRETFPSFFRTVPSDRVQATAMVELLRGLHWNWVAAVGSDDEYGRQGLGLFSSLANAKGICIAYEGLMPLPRAGGTRLGSVQSLLHQVNHSSVQVVVVFSSAQATYSLFSYSIRYRLSPKVWVASEAWLTSSLVMTLPGMDRVGTVLGFLHQGAEMPEFRSYVQTRLARAAEPAYCASLEAGRLGLEEHVVGPRCPQCDRASPENVTDGRRALGREKESRSAGAGGSGSESDHTVPSGAGGSGWRERPPSQLSRGSSPRSQASAAAPGLPPLHPLTKAYSVVGGPPGGPPVRELAAVPPELTGSRQSFQKAMGNPCEFFVDIM